MELQEQINENLLIVDDLIRDSLEELKILLDDREYVAFMHAYQDLYEDIEDVILIILGIINTSMMENSTYSEEEFESMFTQLGEYAHKFMDHTAILIRNHVNEIEKMANK